MCNALLYESPLSSSEELWETFFVGWFWVGGDIRVFDDVKGEVDHLLGKVLFCVPYGFDVCISSGYRGTYLFVFPSCFLMM